MSDVVVVAGARPNFMKVAPIMRVLEQEWPGESVLVHTGQHYDPFMSEVFFEQLRLKRPDVHLQVGSGPHGQQTGRTLEAFEKYLLGRAALPRWVVVVGDVNGTLACALAAAKLGVPVAHVESGLRSGDRSMPEEINRVATDAICDLLLVSEPDGLTNLAREGQSENRVCYVGNVMIDTLVHELEAARALGMPSKLGLAPRRYGLITLHRPSNVDAPKQLAQITSFLQRSAAKLPIVFPVHPRTRQRLEEFGHWSELASCDNLRLLGPLGYRELVGLMETAQVVVTDSGGIQEETTYLGIPCITLRPNTERPVTVSQGTNKVVGDDVERAAAELDAVLARETTTRTAIDGWDGKAAQRIVERLLKAS